MSSAGGSHLMARDTRPNCSPAFPSLMYASIICPRYPHIAYANGDEQQFRPYIDSSYLMIPNRLSLLYAGADAGSEQLPVDFGESLFGRCQ